MKRKSTFESIKKSKWAVEFIVGRVITNIPLSFVFYKPSSQKAMMPSTSQPFVKEPMNEVLTTKVTATQKQEFGIESQQQGLDASAYLRKLIDLRRTTLNMLSFEGIAVPMSKEIEAQFELMAAQQGHTIEEIAAWLLRTFLFSYQQQCKATNSIISLDSVNLSQDIGLQTVTNVNVKVNGGVNQSIPQNTQENPFRVNAPKRLNELMTPVLVTMKIPLLMHNIEILKQYALEESGRFSNISEDTLNAMLFEHFSEDEINLLNELGQFKTH